jgi:hypothetical protein
VGGEQPFSRIREQRKRRKEKEEMLGDEFECQIIVLSIDGCEMLIAYRQAHHPIHSSTSYLSLLISYLSCPPTSRMECRITKAFLPFAHSFPSFPLSNTVSHRNFDQ